jgi:hypothetical protein
MVKSIKTLMLLASVIVISFLFASCNKDRVAHKVEGVWDMVPVGNLKTIDKERWIFKPDNSLVIIRNFYNGMPRDYMDTIEVGSWKIDLEFKKNRRRIDVSGFKDGNVDYYNGEWYIVNLEKDQLFIVNKEVGRLFREFTRQKT